MGDPNFILLPRIVNGGLAATVGAVAVFPLDLVKTRLQNQQIGPNGKKQYSSMFDCMKKILKHEGFFGLYRGLAVNLSLVGVEKGLKLSANDYFRNVLSSEKKRLSLLRQALAGAGAGVIQMLVSCPMELLKIQLQDAGRVAAIVDPKFAVAAGKPVVRLSGLGIATKLIQERGFFGLYRGIIPTAYRDISFAIIYFPLYSYICDMGPTEADGETKLHWHLVCGMLSGTVAAWLATPFDVMKTRCQAISMSKGQRHFTGLWDCYTYTWKTEGMNAFFKGGACRIIVNAPLYAIAQVVYYLGAAEWLLGINRQKSIK